MLNKIVFIVVLMGSALCASCNMQPDPPEAVEQARQTAKPESVEPDDPSGKIPESSAARVVNWGPQKAIVGAPFNAQADGSSVIWIKLDRTIVEAPRVSFNGAPAPRVAAKGAVVTARVPGEYLEASNQIVVSISFENGDEVRVGTLIVSAP